MPAQQSGLAHKVLRASAPAETAAINHGFKAIQIAVSAWTAEALKLTMPASVFSRSTECHNQDKVSMGTIAARDALRVLELTEQVLAAHLLACTQALRLRLNAGALDLARLGDPLATFILGFGDDLPFITEDRPTDRVLARLCDRLRTRDIPV